MIGRVARSVVKTLGLRDRLLFIKRPRLCLRNLGYRLAGTEDGIPIPPAHLINLVITPPEIAWYLLSGRMGFDSICRAMDRINVDVKQFDQVLEFGCGTGRLLWYWTKETKASVHGTDYNPDLVQYTRKALRGRAEISQNQLAPPTTYEDNSFQFIYANSVFTHLPLDLQLPWMNELRRILRPGGYLYVTLHGESRKYAMTEEEWSEFQKGRPVVAASNRAGSNVCAAFHPQAYVHGEFSSGFDVKSYIPNGARHADQDVCILQKK